MYCTVGSTFGVNSFSSNVQLAQPVVAQPTMAPMVVVAQPLPQQVVFLQQTVAVTQLPYAGHTHIERYGGEQCGCDNDAETCVCAWCFPICAAGKVAAFATTPRGTPPGDGACVVWACASYCCFPCVHGVARQRLEERLTVPGQPETPLNFCQACCIDSYLCLWCSLAQELRAIKNAQQRGGAPDVVAAVR